MKNAATWMLKAARSDGTLYAVRTVAIPGGLSQELFDLRVLWEFENELRLFLEVEARRGSA
jgi:hypothetical protein